METVPPPNPDAMKEVFAHLYGRGADLSKRIADVVRSEERGVAAARALHNRGG